MIFTISAALLDTLVLSVVSREDTYGYRITQDIRNVVDVSESTLYPVLRRLQKSDCLTTYDREYMGRNRRYYKITPRGEDTLKVNVGEWVEYKANIDSVILGGVYNE